VSLWAAWSGAVRPLRVTARQLPELVAFRGMPDPLPWEPAGFVLLADPYSFPTQDFLAEVARLHPGVPVVGGMASGARGFGGTRLALGERLFVDGAVGAVLGPGVNLATVVSQGCRPIGRALVVTDSERSVIRSLAGVPPLQRLRELTPELTPADVKAINEGGLKLGVVIDERKAVFGPGDFLLRRVLGGDRDNGAIQISDGIEIGTTAQFHVLDPAAADDELRALAAGAMDDGAPDALLLFTCNGRGRRMFAQPDHDAATLAEVFGTVPAAGMFAAGEVGPVGSRNFVHSLTASVALFREPLVSVRA
jgi:small ligand-binding sensory domain FIST